MTIKNDTILLAHGSGGKLMQDLIADLFHRYFDNEILKEKADAAILNVPGDMIAYTTDSFVVSPVFFPGGDIGKLAVCGTVNDLAVTGADPMYLSAGFIIEEGFSIDKLEKIVYSMASECLKAGVHIVAGDTKIVNKGQCDQIFINTSGIGVISKELAPIRTGKTIQAGDHILVNGFVAEHGLAILSARKNLDIRTEIESDCAVLNHLIKNILQCSSNIRFMRDATRGGLATVLCEILEDSNFGIEINENDIPVKENVKGLCELLGFDPLYIPNEGKIVVIVDKSDSEKVLETMRKDAMGIYSKKIGEVVGKHSGTLLLKTEISGKRILNLLTGEQLPRIC